MIVKYEIPIKKGRGPAEDYIFEYEPTGDEILAYGSEYMLNEIKDKIQNYVDYLDKDDYIEELDCYPDDVIYDVETETDLDGNLSIDFEGLFGQSLADYIENIIYHDESDEIKEFFRQYAQDDIQDFIEYYENNGSQVPYWEW